MSSAEYATVEIDSIRISGANPRKTFDEGSLRELRDSIAEHGILEPLVVRPGTEPDTYELVAGERRLRAVQMIDGAEFVPVVIRELTDEAAAEIMLIENLQREDLAPLEVAAALQQLLAGGSTQEELGKKLGKSQSWISNHLRLLGAPEDLKKLLITREITPKHAYALLPLAGYPAYETAMKDYKRETYNGPVSVKRLEQIVEATVANDYAGNRSLNFDHPGWQHREIMPYLDQTACEGCPDCKKLRVGASNDRVCLKPDCYRRLIEAATAKRLHEREVEKKAMLSSPESQTKGLNLDLLSYSDYNRLSHAQFDKTGCEGCPDNRKTKAGEAVCLKPDCFQAKADQHRKDERAKEADWRSKAEQASDTYLAGRSGPLNDRELRLILETVAASYGFDPMAIIEPWIPDAEERGVDDAQTCVDAIPDADLPRALLAMVLSEIMESYKTDHRALITRINELDQPSTHVVRIPELPEEEGEGEEEEGETPAGTRHWCCPDDEDAVEAKDLDEAKTKIGCSECDLQQNPVECEGPEEVMRE